MTKSEEEISFRIRDKIKEKNPHAEIILYGSHARGDSNKESDWDILVLLDDKNVTLKTEQEYRHHLFDLELELGEPLSIYIQSKEVWETKCSVTPFYKNVRKEGVLLE